MRIRPLIMGRLILRFVFQCFLSGISTARIILKGAPPAAGVVKLYLAPMNSTGAAALGALVTLTPGSSTIDIDMENRVMLVHLLDARQAKTSIEAIRRDFERDITLLFPEDPS